MSYAQTGTVQWDIELTATSAIVHNETQAGSTMLLRREKVFSPEGQVQLVPVISGNSFRGVLRRIGEELMRDELAYEGKLPLAAAFALRNGGSLSKGGGDPISGRRLIELRRLIPQLAVFGAAVGSRTISGSIQCGKVRPVCAETAHLKGLDPSGLPSVFEQVALEPYSHFADGRELAEETTAKDSEPLMRFDIEAFSAGVRFNTWIRLERASAAEVAFVESILDRFAEFGHLGGRSGIGLGQVRVDKMNTSIAGGPWMSEGIPHIDWAHVMREQREDVMSALEGLK